MSKSTIITIVVIVLLAVGGYFLSKSSKEEVVPTNTPSPSLSTTTPSTVVVDKTKTVIGKSVEGNDITAYHFGESENEILFVGGIHGGYEWNTVLVANELIAYLKQNPTAISENIKVTVIPVLNPDGLKKVTGKTEIFTAADVSKSTEVVVSGRFNANNVDLNRNFDCDWKTEGVWQNKKVSGGSAVFSEPESQAFRTYVENSKPKAVIVWYSAAGGVYSSNCHGEVLPATKNLTDLYSKASKYPAYKEFNFYEITGDAVNWLAKKGIPAISVLLTNHTNTEWDKNLAGIKAVLDYYSGLKIN